MEPFLKDLGELSEEESQRVMRNLISQEPRELVGVLLRSRPSRQLRDLQPIPSILWSIWIGVLWPRFPESLEENCWWYLRERYEHQRLLRDLLLLLDQGMEGILLREARVELVRTSRAMFCAGE